MAESSDSERDVEAEEDKILLAEMSRHQSSEPSGSRKRRLVQQQQPTELLPVGRDSEDEDDDDDDDEEEDEDSAAVGQFRDLLKRARLQQLRKEVAEDVGAGGDDDDEDENDTVGKWKTSRRFQYAAGEDDYDEDEEADDDEVGEGRRGSALLMREERDRLRRRVLGVGLASDMPAAKSASSAAAAAAATAAALAASRPRQAAAGRDALVRVSAELPAYTAAGDPGSTPDPLRLPVDMRRAYELKLRLEPRLKSLVGRPESELPPALVRQKWSYILACAYLRMRAAGTQGLHRHPVCRLLAQLSDEKPAKAAASKPTPSVNASAPTAEEESDTAEEVAATAVDREQQQHRPIYWEMQKNIPLRLHKRRSAAKRRKLGDSNPRVKLRDKYRRALIKRRSQVPDVRPETSRYSGEASGIRAGLIKSRQFK